MDLSRDWKALSNLSFFFLNKVVLFMLWGDYSSFIHILLSFHIIKFIFYNTQ